MISAVMLGAGCGLGLWALLVWAAPTRTPLGLVFERLRRQPEPPAIPTADRSGWAARAGRRTTPLLRSAGLPSLGVRRDLAVIGRDVDAHLAEKATVTLLGLLAPAAFDVMLLAVGAPLDPTVPVFGALAFGALGFLAPDLRVRSEARRRRTDFRHALSAYLDLVQGYGPVMSVTMVRPGGLRVGGNRWGGGRRSRHVRYYERAGLLPKPARTPAGYRTYDASAIDRLRFIQGAQRLGLHLRDIADLLAVRDTGVCPCEPAEVLLRRRLTDVDAEMARLAALRAHGGHAQGPALSRLPAAVTWHLVPHRRRT